MHVLYIGSTRGSTTFVTHPPNSSLFAYSVIGMRSFGCSAPAKEVQKRFGFTSENAVLKVRAYIYVYIM